MKTNRHSPSSRQKLKLLAFPIIFAAFLASGANAQDKGASQAISVSLGISAAKPNEVIDIPVTISGPKDAKIGEISFDVTYPKDKLTFMNGEPGLAGEEAEVKVEATTKDEGENVHMSADITAKQPMKYGILAYLKFRAAKDIKKGSFNMKLDNVKVSGLDKAPIEVAKGKDGEITVFEADEEVPVLGCFFFSH